MRSEAKKFLHLAVAFSYHLSGMASLLNRVRDSEEVTASYSQVIQVMLDVRDRVAKAVAVFARNCARLGAGPRNLGASAPLCLGRHAAGGGFDSEP